MRTFRNSLIGAAVWLGAAQLGAFAAMPPATGEGGATGADFSAATQAIARHDDRQAAADLRDAAALLDREADRAGGDAKRALVAARADLERSARALDHGTEQTAHELDRSFARADHAMALAQREQAAQSWSEKAYARSGRELKEAAASLDDAGDWVGGRAQAAAHAAAAGADAFGDKLARGGHWARDEVASGFDSLGRGLDELGRDVGVHAKARKLPAAG
jgi:hypothetical protein